MANCCPKAMSFFGVIQRIYTLFSSSTKRWKIFKDHVKGLTVNPLSQTRWESHVESVKPIKEQIAQIRYAFMTWQMILLHAINTMSKFLQSENMDIDVAIEFLQGIVLFLEEFREDDYDKAMVEDKEMACDMGIEAVFREKRVIRRKKQFGESNIEEVIQLAAKSFRINYFLFIIDQARSSMKARFEQFQKYEETFGLLFNLERLQRTDYEPC
ncbi:uncharacterized protein [Primulina huaijiensis]|uniref:uncharacterized protein n=1 Tax=Primulina huaijiensis TaxID=1492673 RepID=UPI003CC6FEE7